MPSRAERAERERVVNAGWRKLIQSSSAGAPFAIKSDYGDDADGDGDALASEGRTTRSILNAPRGRRETVCDESGAHSSKGAGPIRQPCRKGEARRRPKDLSRTTDPSSAPFAVGFPTPASPAHLRSSAPRAAAPSVCVPLGVVLCLHGAGAAWRDLCAPILNRSCFASKSETAESVLRARALCAQLPSCAESTGDVARVPAETDADQSAIPHRLARTAQLTGTAQVLSQAACEP